MNVRGWLVFFIVLCQLCAYAFGIAPSAFIESKKFINGIPSGLQIVNVGSSSGKYGFDWSVTQYKGANLAMWPQGVVEDFVLLRHYERNCESNAVVVLPICPFTSILGKSYGADFSKRIRYYPFLSRKEIENYSWRLDLEVWFSLKRWAIPPDASLTFDGVPDSVMFKQFADGMIAGWKSQFVISDLNAPIRPGLRRDYEDSVLVFREIIDWCRKHFLRPVVVLPPVTEYYDEAFSDQFVQTYILDFLQDVDRANVPFLNYLKDCRFRNHRYYLNAFMLNVTGRKAFTAQVVKDLEELGMFK